MSLEATRQMGLEASQKTVGMTEAIIGQAQRSTDREDGEYGDYGDANLPGYDVQLPGEAVVSQWCHSGVTVVLQWCYSGVFTMFTHTQV
jgi:hypothetical protein